MGIVQSIVVGVLSGVVASICYTLIKQILKPRVKVANILVRLEKPSVFVVKVINRSHVPIRDVDCYLVYYERIPDGYRTRTLESRRDNTSTIEKYVNDKDDPNAASLYAVQYAFEIPSDLNFDSDDKLVFSFKATHPISGTSVYITEEYRINTDDIRENVSYNSGNNIGVHNN